MTDATVVRLDAASGSRIDLAELWRYRHLALLLAWRDIRVRYHQTAIGIGWAILQPCATMVFFSLFFGRLAKLPSDGLPYPVFYYSGLLPWMYFSHAVTNATNVLHEQARIISRVYFPRMVMPLAPVLAGLVDLAVAFTVLVALMAWSGLRPAGSSFLAPLFLGLGVLTASAVSLWLSALNSRFRDVKYALTFGLQLWMYASPVVYPMTLVPARCRSSSRPSASRWSGPVGSCSSATWKAPWPTVCDPAVSRWAVRAMNLGKTYELHPSRSTDSLRVYVAQAIAGTWRRAETGCVRALDGLSFEIPEGETVGIVGPNGAGKTTLARILARITAPTSGFVEVRGRVGSLLDIGLGFHPDLTGRENVFVGGAMLGMSVPEIRRHFDGIIAFAGIERFLDAPVKSFSAGMSLRLAFALASHVECATLLVDEVLSVGDAAFQQRSLQRLRELSYEGRTIMLISHQLDAVAQVCARTLRLANGCIVADGPTPAVLERYLSEVSDAERDPQRVVGAGARA